MWEGQAMRLQMKRRVENSKLRELLKAIESYDRYVCIVHDIV